MTHERVKRTRKAIYAQGWGWWEAQGVVAVVNDSSPSPSHVLSGTGQHQISVHVGY